MIREQLKKINDEIGYIKLYKRGSCIIIWFNHLYHTYWDYTQREAIKLFKEKYGIQGKVEKSKTCPYLF
jgi:hypothetical protein